MQPKQIQNKFNKIRKWPNTTQRRHSPHQTRPTCNVHIENVDAIQVAAVICDLSCCGSEQARGECVHGIKACEKKKCILCAKQEK